MMNSVTNGISAAAEEEDDVKDYFLGFVSDRAKPCVDKAIDYTLLVVTLALQYFRCKDFGVNVDVNSDESLDTDMNNATSLESDVDLDVTATDLECDFSADWINFSEDDYIKVLIWVLIGIGISYGIIVSALIWIHSACNSDTKIHKKTENLYKCTDRIFLIDSILEIPISFIKAPIITVSLWSAYVTALGGLYFLTMKYGELIMDEEMGMNDMNAKNVFMTSAVLVAVSLYKFTGEVSQYWVIYTASKKYEKEEKSKKSSLRKSKVKVKATNFGEKDEESLEFLSENHFHSTFDDEEEGGTVGSGTVGSGTDDFGSSGQYAKKDKSKKSSLKKSRVKVKARNFEDKEDKEEESLELISDNHFDNTFDDEEKGGTVWSGTVGSGTVGSGTDILGSDGAKEGNSEISNPKKSKVKVKATNFEEKEDEESLEFISDEEAGGTSGSGTVGSGVGDSLGH